MWSELLAAGVAAFVFFWIGVLAGVWAMQEDA